ncbi:probable transcription factor At5g61620 isoform X2 [Hevea brasiliensis]|uniref:probable transcription factor At5g61620 isoform X2 n=1 Tax=Hevea brasiliensis TaxID=3981 RepID=UPI0025D3275E|nr:probable transcription factor At5g61620 isoform X2 [Hevea brasiliensis]
MVKEATRKCSHCGQNGHNSRTCNGKVGVKLFGVRILEKQERPMKKSASLGNLDSLVNNSTVHHHVDDGSFSDGYVSSKRGKAIQERKRGKPWTEEEHQTFLAGLEKLGKGDWRGISKNFVTTRTPTQVASHAQKFFLRKASTDKKKRGSSLFDMKLKESQGYPSNGQSFVGVKTMPTSPLVQIMKYNYARLGYPYTLKSPGSFASCALLTNNPSGIPTPRSLPVSFSQEGPSTENVDPPELDLKIGPPPQSPKAASLSPRASGPISVI